MKKIYVIVLLTQVVFAQKFQVDLYPEVHKHDLCKQQKQRLIDQANAQANKYLGLENYLYQEENLSDSIFGLDTARTRTTAKYFISMLEAILNQQKMMDYYTPAYQQYSRNNGQVDMQVFRTSYEYFESALFNMMNMFDLFFYYEKIYPDEYGQLIYKIINSDGNMTKDLYQVEQTHAMIYQQLITDQLQLNNLNYINDVMTQYLEYFYTNKRKDMIELINDNALLEDKVIFDLHEVVETGGYVANLTNRDIIDFSYVNQHYPGLINDYIKYGLMYKNHMFLTNLLKFIDENNLDEGDHLSLVVGKNHIYGLQRMLAFFPRFKDKINFNVQADCAPIPTGN